MQQLTLTGPGELDWLEVPDPRIGGPESAVVRPVAVATCDFDHLMVAGSIPTGGPVAIGHELVAEVVEVGGEVRGSRAGDLAVVPFQINCGTCEPCRRGHTSSCANVPWLSCYGLGEASGGWGGAMSDLLAVPYADAMLVPLPEGVGPADAAAASCNIPDAYRCVGPQLADLPGAPVLVAGGAFGNIALYSVALALALGASRVDYVDVDAERSARAERLGATLLAADDVEPGAYPITVDASQSLDLLTAVIRATAPAGICTVSPMYLQESTPVPLFDMFQRCVTLATGQPHARALLEPVLELIAAGTFRPSELVDEVVAWEEAPAAFGSGSGKRVCVRKAVAA